MILAAIPWVYNAIVALDYTRQIVNRFAKHGNFVAVKGVFPAKCAGLGGVAHGRDIHGYWLLAQRLPLRAIWQVVIMAATALSSV